MIQLEADIPQQNLALTCWEDHQFVLIMKTIGLSQRFFNGDRLYIRMSHVYEWGHASLSSGFMVGLWKVQ